MKCLAIFLSILLVYVVVVDGVPMRDSNTLDLDEVENSNNFGNLTSNHCVFFKWLWLCSNWHSIKSCEHFAQKLWTFCSEMSFQQIRSFLNDPVAQKPPPTLITQISVTWWARELKLSQDVHKTIYKLLGFAIAFLVPSQEVSRPNWEHFW